MSNAKQNEDNATNSNLGILGKYLMFIVGFGILVALVIKLLSNAAS